MSSPPDLFGRRLPFSLAALENANYSGGKLSYESRAVLRWIRITHP